MKINIGPIENLFFTYANHSLSDNPKYFYKIFDEVIPYFSMLRESISSINKMIELIIRFAECNDSGKAKNYLDKLESNRAQFQSQYTSITFLSSYLYVYGYTEGHCQGICPLGGGIEKTKALGEGCLSGENRLKCYECEQKYFLYILESIIKGTEYSDITGFSNFITQHKNVIKNGVVIELNDLGDQFREKLKKNLIWDSLLTYISLGQFLGGAISYSLSEFLTNEQRGRLRLKRCLECGDFFPGRTDQKWCSKKCYKKGYHREYMRKKRDPESTDYDQRYKIREFG